MRGRTTEHRGSRGRWGSAHPCIDTIYQGDIYVKPRERPPCVASVTSVTARATAGLRGADRVPPQALLLVSITSVQFGGALAVHLLGDVGAAGGVFLRLAFAALALVVLVRPRVRALRRDQLELAVLFGAVLAGMNLAFYEALERLPLGITVTIEFAGPLSVAVAL